MLFLLVGTKMDIRDDTAALEYLKKKNIELLTKRDGEVVSGRVGASLLMECSAKTQMGLKSVFVEAIQIVLSNRRVKKHPNKKNRKGRRDKCTIL